MCRHLYADGETPSDARRPDRRTSIAATVAQTMLGLFLLVAGTGHLTVARDAFQAQVPTWLPADPDVVVVASGVVELLLGLSLLLLWRWRIPLGWVVAGFFVAVFPGNISQFTTGTDSFGLDDDLSRGIRLLFQPLLVLWALWSTGAWRAWRAGRAAARRR
jgi:uncharacterized membrane protein